MNWAAASLTGKSARPKRRGVTFAGASLLWLLLNVAGWVESTPAQSWQTEEVAGTEATASGSAQAGAQQLTGTVTGTVTDATGGAIAGAQIKLSSGAQSSVLQGQSASDGSFFFGNVPPGLFFLAITATGFAEQNFSGTLHPGEIDVVPPVALALAANVTEVRVIAPSTELAEAQIKTEEKQRVLGVIPNFYVTYVADAAPLDAKQKFELAWKMSVDPITFGLTAAAAGFQQAEDQFEGYGQGAQGYGKRFGAIYADTVAGTFIGSAMLPSLLKQDPRYFYKGTGTVRSRILYAMANAVICKGDNKHWQPNYSSVGGSLAAGGIANLYYPAENRGVTLTFENALIEIGESAAGNLFEEFLSRKLTTPNLLKHSPAKS